MKLYLCENQRQASAIAAELRIGKLGPHAFYDEGRSVAWFFGEPSVPVEFHPAQPISRQLIGLKEILGQVGEVIVIDTGSSSRRDAGIVLNLLGYAGGVSTYTSRVAAAAIDFDATGLERKPDELGHVV